MSEHPHPITLTQRARSLTAHWLLVIGKQLYSAGIHPDLLTAIGLGIVALASILIGAGHLQIGGFVLLLGLTFDALDGAVARAMERKNKFGVLLDSTLDRYADGFIFCGIGYYFAVQDAFGTMLLTLIALMGSYGVSYVRARAEALDVRVTIGWFSRLERVIIVLFALLIPPVLPICLWVLAIGTNVTALHRLWFVHKTLTQRKG